MKGEDAEERHSSVSTGGRTIEMCLIVVALLAVTALALQRIEDGRTEDIPVETTISSDAHIQAPPALPSTAIAARSSEPPKRGNAAPVITGEPAPFVVQGAPYVFEPQAFDLDADQELTFTISGMPHWALFEPSNGTLMGVPQEENVGLYEGVVITVSDGIDMATLGPFSIEVLSAATGTALIEWTPPSDTVDGSPFPGISGYRIEYGQSPDELLQTINVDNPGVASYLVDNLAPGAWYFRVIAYDVGGLETKPTPIVEKIVQ